ncbi:MAG: leucyl aminopeptidase family protein [Tumebacillaceae bacterium]
MNFTTGSFQAGRLTVLPAFAGQSFETLGLSLKEYYGKAKDHPVAVDHKGTRFVVIGLGDQEKFTLNKYRNAVMQGIRAAIKEGEQAITFLLPSGTNATDAELATVTAEGALLGQYRFDKYKANKEEVTVQNVTIANSEGALSGLEDAIKTGRIYAEGTMIARDLMNEPGNKLRPYDLAQFAVEHFKGTKATVEVIKGDALVDNKFVGLITVGKGSDHPPAMVKITFQNDASKPLTSLVGKGMTFDTGGVSLKTYARDLSDMRFDMGGAAAVVGAMHILTQLDAPVNVVSLLCACENAIGGGAVLPGDLIEYPNGTSVQVGNTDAEGRLVLADALIHSQDLGAERVIDIATLTGACAAALGSKLGGLFSNNEEMAAELKKSANATGELVWELPLFDEYDDLLYSAYADVRNISDGGGGAITAALFLRRFVGKEQKWSHLDIAGQMEYKRTGSFSNEGGQGFGARLMADYVINN